MPPPVQTAPGASRTKSTLSPISLSLSPFLFLLLILLLLLFGLLQLLISGIFYPLSLWAWLPIQILLPKAQLYITSRCLHLAKSIIMEYCLFSQIAKLTLKPLFPMSIHFVHWLRVSRLYLSVFFFRNFFVQLKWIDRPQEDVTKVASISSKIYPNLAINQVDLHLCRNPFCQVAQTNSVFFIGFFLIESN